MYTLGIETSCDETSCSVLKDKDELLSNVISSSLFRHQPFGGVVPEIASRHCLEQIDLVFEETLKQAKIRLEDIHLVAVTYGPGLIGSLIVGVAFAKTLSYQLGIPIIGVNHLEAHLVASFIGAEEPGRFIGLLVSGGHTSLSYHEKGKVELLGETVDDAAGEAFDKAAKLLGLGYPGGPLIEKLALKGNEKKYKFTKPKQDQPFDFSFSGIKTAVKLLVEKEGTELSENFICDMAASFQKCVVDWLVEKTMAAVKAKQVQHGVIGGGVSANQYLRNRLEQGGKEHGCKFLVPSKILSLDNAGMIARRGWELYQQGQHSDLHLTGVANLPMKSVR